MSYVAILYVLGWMIVVLAAAMSLPILAASAQGDDASFFAFVTSAALTAFVGGGLVISLRGSDNDTDRRESLLLAVLVWLVLPMFAALPFYGSGFLGSLTESYFEAVSGLTTTGLSMLAAPEEAPRAILLWRAMLQWIGGLGTVVIAVTILATFGIGGLQLYQGTLPRGEADTILRRIQFNAKAFIGIYSGLTLTCIIAMWALGLEVFEAVCYSFSAVSTGAFTIHSDGLAHYGSLAIEMVIALFLVIGAFPMPVLFEAGRGRWREVRRNPEVGQFLIALGLFVGVFFIFGWLFAGRPLMEVLRIDLLQAISLATTSGLMMGGEPVVDRVPAALILIAIVIGGCSLSTAGGIKIMRVLILLKHGNRELFRLAHPRGITRFQYGSQRVEEDAILSVWTFFAIFSLCIAGAAILLSANGLDFPDALNMAVAALTNTGLSQFVSGPGESGPIHLADMNHGAKWTLTGAMILGRLEVLALFMMIYKSYWRG